MCAVHCTESVLYTVLAPEVGEVLRDRKGPVPCDLQDDYLESRMQILFLALCVS